MSHFSVVVRIDGAVPAKDLVDTLARMMVPYKEYGCGAEDPIQLKDYLEFQDITEELEKDFVDRKDKSQSWHDFLKESGYNEHNGRYGYWKNPNQKWDWYVVGGRWKDYFTKVTGVKTNICRINEIDFAGAEAEQNKRFDTFCREYQQLLRGKEWDIFEGPREVALELGLIQCKNENELTGEDRDSAKSTLISWGQDRNRYDVCKLVTPADLEPFRKHFFPIKGFARLDKSGWIEQGEMGWFGCSSTTPETALAHSGSTMEWYQSGDQNDWIIIADCHI